VKADHQRATRLLPLKCRPVANHRARSKAAPKLKDFKRRVRIIFGDADPYLNKGVAQRFHGVFPASDLFLLPVARHFVQMDEPEEVAHLVLSVPTIGFSQY
jgi:haloalkane dehalogenase